MLTKSIIAMDIQGIVCVNNFSAILYNSVKVLLNVDIAT